MLMREYVCHLFLQLRHVIDPKRHFKRAGKSKALPKYFQVSSLITIRIDFILICGSGKLYLSLL
jgi:hypothetical protein